MDDEGSESKQRRLWGKIALVLAVLILATGLTIGIIIYKKNNPVVQLPPAIAKQISFKAYLPTKLPGNYKIKDDSFSYDEGVLIFQATDSTGSSITFTEQPKPKNFDFATFYREQMTEAETLSDVPFPSVIAKLQDGKMHALSVVTDGPWIVATTLSPLDNNDLKIIAQNLARIDK